MLTRIPLLSCAFIAALSCQMSREQIEANQDLVGVWSVHQLHPEAGREYEQSLVGIRQIPSGELTAVHVDLRPSGGVWVNESAIRYVDRILTYTAPDWGGGASVFEGRMADDNRTVRDLSGNRYPTLWRRTEDARLLRFMREIDSLLASPRPRSYLYRTPAATDDGWTTGRLADVGLDSALLTRMVTRILEGRYDDIHSLLVVKDGRLVLEEYFRAGGSLHGPFLTEWYRDRPHHLASFTKSVTSLLTGIAIELGLIDGPDASVMTFFPGSASPEEPRRDRILLHHLLTMTSGLQWDEDSDPGAMWTADDVVAFYLAKPMVAEPGAEFTYSNGSATTVGAIIERAAGTPADSFALAHLFRPLGISRWSWQVYTDGATDTDGGLALRGRDLAKLGQLMLQNGQWNGSQVVPADWVRESTREHVRLSDRRAYGYLWWHTTFRVDGEAFSSFYAFGWGGQYLFVFPALDLVVVSTGGNFAYEPERHLFRMLETYILPAVVAE